MKKIREKSDKELEKMLKTHREEIRKFRFGISGSGKKNVREARLLKKEVAQILTEMNTRKNSANSAK
jgi:ribosomal protein L29